MTPLNPKSSPYTFQKKISSGSFGVIYHGQDTRTNKQVAIKIESLKKSGSSGQLAWEYKIYKAIGGIPIPTTRVKWPRVHALGTDGEGHAVMVMDLLGPSLDAVLKFYNGRLPPPLVAFVADRTINLLRVFHNAGFIHRDIKPQNLAFEYGDQKYPELFLIDYGLAKDYIDREKNEHSVYLSHRSMKGTVRYSSITTHLGIEQSRRDDLAALGYMLVYLLKGGLPWQNIPKLKETKDDYAHILRHKMNTPVERLVEGAGPPDLQRALIEYITIVNSYGYYDTPDYDYLRNLFATSKEKFTGLQLNKTL